MRELKSENEILTEEKHRTTSAVKSQNCEKVDPSVTKKHNEDGVGNIPRLLNFVDRDNSINGRGNKMEDSVTPCTISSTKFELSEKGECYTDKSVMDCEVPEQIPCFKVDACHVVKDICVDEGVPSPDKVLIEHGEVDLKRSFQPSYLDFNDVSRKSVDSPSLISDDLKSSIGHYHNMDVSGQCGSENLSHKSEENIHPKDDIAHNEMNSLVELIHTENVSIQCSKNQLQKGEANVDAKYEIPHNIPDERLVPENMLLFHNWDKENGRPDSYQFKSDEGQQHSEQEQHCSVENLLQKNEGKIDVNDDIVRNIDTQDEIPHNIPDERVVPDNMLLFHNWDKENGHPDSYQFKSDKGQQHSEQKQHCSVENLLQKNEGKINANDDIIRNIDTKDEIPHNIPDERVVPENMLLSHNWDKENGHPDSYQFKSDKGQQHSEQEQHCSVENLLQKNGGKIDANDVTKCVSDDVLPLNILLLQKPDIENSGSASSNFNGNEVEQQSVQDTSKEPITAYSAVCSVAEEPSNSNCADKPPFDSKVERGSITFNFDSLTTSSRELSPHNAYPQHLQTLPGGLEDGIVDSLTTSSRSFFIQDGHGESSFSAVDPLSGPISYSGPISHSGLVPYSGSISLRSDSSTTSTRSFAFPILHSEWNSSPVKMAKADRRHFRKHRGWRLNLLCCRF